MEPTAKKLHVLINHINFGKDTGKDVSKMEAQAKALYKKMAHDELISPYGIKEFERRLDRAIAKQGEGK